MENESHYDLEKKLNSEMTEKSLFHDIQNPIPLSNNGRVFEEEEDSFLENDLTDGISEYIIKAMYSVIEEIWNRLRSFYSNPKFALERINELFETLDSIVLAGSTKKKYPEWLKAEIKQINDRLEELVDDTKRPSTPFGEMLNKEIDNIREEELNRKERISQLWKKVKSRKIRKPRFQGPVMSSIASSLMKKNREKKKTTQQKQNQKGKIKIGRTSSKKGPNNMQFDNLVNRFEVKKNENNDNDVESLKLSNFKESETNRDNNNNNNNSISMKNIVVVDDLKPKISKHFKDSEVQVELITENQPFIRLGESEINTESSTSYFKRNSKKDELYDSSPYNSDKNINKHVNANVNVNENVSETVQNNDKNDKYSPLNWELRLIEQREELEYAHRQWEREKYKELMDTKAAVLQIQAVLEANFGGNINRLIEAAVDIRNEKQSFETYRKDLRDTIEAIKSFNLMFNEKTGFNSSDSNNGRNRNLYYHEADFKKEDFSNLIMQYEDQVKDLKSKMYSMQKQLNDIQSASESSSYSNPLKKQNSEAVRNELTILHDQLLKAQKELSIKKGTMKQPSDALDNDIKHHFLEVMEQSFQGDYMELGIEPYVKIKLNDTENILFSDMVTLFDRKGKKLRQIILITSFNILFFEVNRVPPHTLRSTFRIDDLKMLTLSKKSTDVIVLHHSTQFDFLISAARRSEICFYLFKAYFDLTNLRLGVVHSDKFFLQEKDGFVREVQVLGVQQLKFLKAVLNI